MGRGAGDVPPEMLEGTGGELDDAETIARHADRVADTIHRVMGTEPVPAWEDAEPERGSERDRGERGPAARAVRAAVERRVAQQDPERWRREERRTAPFVYERSGV